MKAMKDNQHAIEVVAGWVRREDRVLICRRAMHKARGGQWEFAGGKVEPGETMAQALVREFREELDFDLKPLRVISEVTHMYSDVCVHLTLLEAEAISGEVRALEHSEIRWVRTEQLPDFDLCPADRELVQRMAENGDL